MFRPREKWGWTKTRKKQSGVRPIFSRGPIFHSGKTSIFVCLRKRSLRRLIITEKKNKRHFLGVIVFRKRFHYFAQLIFLLIPVDVAATPLTSQYDTQPTNFRLHYGWLDYQPLFGKGALAPPITRESGNRAFRYGRFPLNCWIPRQPPICLFLNNNIIYCVPLRSLKNADQRKQ